MLVGVGMEVGVGGDGDGCGYGKGGVLVGGGKSGVGGGM